jgi:predicted AAA+ superfamily ATPase
MEGGRVLLIDQVFKYHEWWKELLYCYDNFPELKIIFTSSSVIDFDDPLYGLKDKAEIFHLRGFSLREFIEIYSGFRYHSFSFEEILKYHMEIAADVCNKIKPLAFVDDYLTFGFYPFSLEKKNFSENLLKTANLMLEMDILSVHRMDPSYLPKVRKLLYLIALRNGKIPNITRLSEDISTSRQTVVNYINHLTVARLVNLIHKKKSNSRKNLMKLYIHNPNLLNMICPFSENRQSVYETFFYNNMSLFPFHFASPNAQFLVKEEYLFCVSDHILGRFDPNCYYATAGIERGDRKVIPLWLFGFLY